MRAKPGDSLVIKGHRVGEADRQAEILEVRGGASEPRYLVRWADGHEGWVYPGSDAVVEHQKKEQKSP
jgi:hypothetical protein